MFVKLMGIGNNLWDGAAQLSAFVLSHHLEKNDYVLNALSLAVITSCCYIDLKLLMKPLTCWVDELQGSKDQYRSQPGTSFALEVVLVAPSTSNGHYSIVYNGFRTHFCPSYF